jgi:hypothetical protein
MLIIIMNKRSRITRPRGTKAKPLRRNRLERNHSREHAGNQGKFCGEAGALQKCRLWRAPDFAHGKRSARAPESDLDE